MSTVYDMLQKWAEAQGVDAVLLKHHLEKLELEDKVIPKLYSKDLDAGGKVYEIFDVNAIEVKNLKGVHHRRLEILPGITMVCGPNDAGKSTFLDGLEIAIRGARGEALPALIRNGTAELQVKLTATACEIDRQYNRKVVTRGKNAGDVKFEHQLTVSIDGTKDNKVEQAQALLQSWAQVDLDFVIRSSMVRQGHLADALEDEASKRQALFYRLLAMDAAEETRAAIAKVAKDEAAKAGASAGSTERLELELMEVKKKLALYKMDQMHSRLSELEATVGSGTARVDREARLSLINRAIAQHGKLAELRDKYRARIAEFNKSPALFMEVADVAPKQAQAEHGVRVTLRHQAVLQERLERCMEQGRAVKHAGTCVTCATPLGAESKANTHQKLKAVHAEITAELERVKTAGVQASEQWTHFSNERVRMAAIAAEKKGIQNNVAVMHELPEMIDMLVMGFDLKGAKADAEALTKSMAETAQDPKLVDELAQVRKWIGEAEALKAQVSALERTIAQQKTKHEPRYSPAVLEQLELAFSKRGMPLWIARQHIGRVNAIAAEIAAGDRYRYEFGQELDVVIRDGELEVSPRAASGSSRQRGALVLLASLALYLQELAQIRIPFLWIDEIPFQDEANQALIVEVLRALNKRVPKIIFGASQWDAFAGKFDREVHVRPGVLESPTITANTPAIAPIVKLHGQPAASPAALPETQMPACDMVKTAPTIPLEPPVAPEIPAPRLPTFEELEARLSDPMNQQIPEVPTLDLEDDDPF